MAEVPQETTSTFVARQPVFDREFGVLGYELLFRSGATNTYSGDDGDQSTLAVMSAALMDFGLDDLVGQKRAFVNFTGSLLKTNAATMLPPDRVIIEILEDVVPDAETIDACTRLKKQGYTLALDDFVGRPDYGPLIELADIIKVDFRASDAEERIRFAEMTRPRGSRLLAEKVETITEFERALTLGYSLFQGYFFSRPVLMSGRSMAPSEITCLEAFREVRKPDMDYGCVASIIKRDVSFTYSLLRYINSAAIGLRTRIQSVRQALTLLGQKETARWLSLAALHQLSRGKPSELLVTSVVRGRMAELLSGPAGLKGRATDMFLLGAFSSIDALLGRPKEEVVMQLPLADDVQKALLGEMNPLRAQLELVMAYERAEWEKVAASARALGVDEAILPGLYMESLVWANTFVPDHDDQSKGTPSYLRNAPVQAPGMGRA